MKTKKEILEHHYEIEMAKNTSGWPLQLDKVYEAGCDEYAMQVAIDFAQWLDDNDKLMGDYTGNAAIKGDLTAHFYEYQQERSSLK